MKRIISILLCLMMIVSVMPMAEVHSAGTTLIVHYQREDDDYQPWNLWVWPEGGEGEVYEFEYEDDYGVVAVIQHSVTADQFGFIVRTNDWDKDIGSDRFVDTSSGETEIWLMTGVEEVLVEAPEGYETFDVSTAAVVEEAKPVVIEGDTLPVKVHYHRYDANYEGWNLWMWSEGGEGASYNFDSEDEFGAVANINLSGASADGNVGLIVRLNDWEAKDVDSDRFMAVSKMNNEGVLEVWLVQGDASLYHAQEDIDLSPKFISAQLDGMDRINITVTVPFVLKDSKTSFDVIANDGSEIEVKHVTVSTPTDLVSVATVLLEEPLQVGKTYEIRKEGYGTMAIAMDSIFSSDLFEEAFTYQENDLGVTYSQDESIFKVWAPTASEVKLNLYSTGHEDDLIESISMVSGDKGVYSTEVVGDQHGVYYTYEVTVNDMTYEAVDPYARTTGVNGDRAMVVDFHRLNPDGWEEDAQLPLKAPTDAIIYELHVRDLSTAPNSGIEQVGKFLGLTESGTVNGDGLSTGLDHLKELGITHLHLLPSFDYRSINETQLDNNAFNWGYDPENYNVPEGSYATDPYDGSVRVTEFKTMVQTLHENDISVVMDVVYNHTGASADSHLNRIVPNYYYRIVNGAFSNGSGCGNEIASERAMVRKMIVDSVVFWATEYHIDGFRFDLMGLHDVETMQAVRAALDEIDPSIIVYGEGWTGGASPLPDTLKAIKANTYQMPGVAAFSDDMRDGIKGHVFTENAPGFINGHQAMEESVKFGIVAATKHPQVAYNEVNYSTGAWAGSPSQSVNYISAHDNLTLFDKLSVTNPEASKDEKADMVKLGNAIVMTSQGIPFMHAGVEMLRTKEGDHNSYQSSDEVNQIDWQWKTDNLDVVEYHKGLIALRKAHPAFRMTTTEDVAKHLMFFGEGDKYGDLQMSHDQVVGYMIDGHANGDEAGAIIVIHNANTDEVEVRIPEGIWTVLVDKSTAGVEGIRTLEGNTAMVEGISTLVLTREEPVGEFEVVEVDEGPNEDSDIDDDKEPEEEKGRDFAWLFGLGGILVIVAGIFGYRKFKK